MLQQRYADKINAVMVTRCDEVLAVAGKIVPVLGECREYEGRVADEPRESWALRSWRAGTHTFASVLLIGECGTETASGASGR